MADESVLKTVIARLEAALNDPNPGRGPDVYEVRGYDVGVLFETIKRYGGRRDWTPTPENIDRLPGPVRRYIHAQWAEISRLQVEATRSATAARRAEAELARLRRPAR